VITLLAVFASRASAGEDDDDLDLDDDIDLPAPSPSPAPVPAAPAPPPPQPDDGDDEDGGLEVFRDADDTDLLGEEPTGPTSGDTEQIFRATQTRLAELEPDEQILGWEAYLAKYPTTPYRTRIEKLLEDLNEQLYDVGIVGPDGPVDANKQELTFAHPLQLENVNPRTRLNVGFEYGLPSYANLALDYEHALARKFSVHGGVKQRYLGFNAEAGVRYALVKSPRTQTLVTAMLDVRVNVNPAYPGFRPQLAVAKRFGKLDAMLIGGADLVLSGGLKPNLQAGGMMYYAASDRVGMFLEGNAYFRSLPAEGVFDGGTAMFDVATFGLKFFPGKEGAKQDKEINIGATVPVATQYWQFHYGSIMAQFNYYL
jgi:hypothetical protein